MSVGDPGERGDRRPASVIERLRALFGLGQGSIRDDIEEALDDNEAGADAFSPQERALMRNVLNLHDLRVEDVMVPRADVIAVSEDLTLGAVLKEFQTAGHSRLPVYGGTLDDARGMVHIRDFVAHLAATSLPADDAVTAAAAETAPDPAGLGKELWSRTLKDSGLVRTVLFVPPSMQALDLLVRMQAFRTHMALVIDEYGGTDGLVSIEDVVEMIVGNIEDEHDEGEGAKVTRNLDGSFVADARADLAEVSAAIGIELKTEDDAEVDTLGGLIGALAGHVPGRGEVVRARDDVAFEILDADPRRIKRVRIILATPADAAASEAGRTGDAARAAATMPPT